MRVPRGLRVRQLHKAFLRYHDAENWPRLRAALKRMGRADLIGDGEHQLVPAWQPSGIGERRGRVRGKPKGKAFRTQHTGLPDAPASKHRPGSRKA